MKSFLTLHHLLHLSQSIHCSSEKSEKFSYFSYSFILLPFSHFFHLLIMFFFCSNFYIFLAGRLISSLNFTYFFLTFFITILDCFSLFFGLFSGLFSGLHFTFFSLVITFYHIAKLYLPKTVYMKELMK